MKIINVTSNYPELVHEQLRNTDALTVEVYSAGNTDVVYTRASTHHEIIVTNKHRAIRPEEREEIKQFFIKKRIDQKKIDKNNISTIEEPKLIEISIPIID
ncbi:DUF1827 family protein [Pseudolactococcus insecticola]|uniref:Ribose-5-phosphate isomerase n=1 Tax=Pseudolactococcus insecticola TaxID=2709158 RepID=A0A6A0BA05_9LACT|nr:DUF1827 family protein [Lactococcus insecticola]GFH41194.1 hypothetical protein Hs20B_15920 [Lactococcus insecticola]